MVPKDPLFSQLTSPSYSGTPDNNQKSSSTSKYRWLHWCCCINIELKADVDPYCSSRLASIIDLELGGMKQQAPFPFAELSIEMTMLSWFGIFSKTTPALYPHSPKGAQLDLLWSTVPKLFHSPPSLPNNIIRSNTKTNTSTNTNTNTNQQKSPNCSIP